MTRPRDVPERYERLYKLAMTGRRRAEAIRMFCIECMGYQSAEVPRCTDPHCPLYLYRMGPGQLQKPALPLPGEPDTAPESLETVGAGV